MMKIIIIIIIMNKAHSRLWFLLLQEGCQMNASDITLG